VRASDGGRNVVVADQKQGRDLRLREAHDAPAPLALKGRRGRTILVRVPRKDDQVHFLVNRRVHDGIQRLQEIEHAQGQSRDGIAAAIVGHVNVRVGKVEEFHVRNPEGM